MLKEYQPFNAGLPTQPLCLHLAVSTPSRSPKPKHCGGGCANGGTQSGPHRELPITLCYRKLLLRPYRPSRLLFSFHEGLPRGRIDRKTALRKSRQLWKQERSAGPPATTRAFSVLQVRSAGRTAFERSSMLVCPRSRSAMGALISLVRYVKHARSPPTPRCRQRTWRSGSQRELCQLPPKGYACSCHKKNRRRKSCPTKSLYQFWGIKTGVIICCVFHANRSLIPR